jgi:hypothetical protein
LHPVNKVLKKEVGSGGLPAVLLSQLLNPLRLLDLVQLLLVGEDLETVAWIRLQSCKIMGAASH